MGLGARAWRNIIIVARSGDLCLSWLSWNPYWLIRFPSPDSIQRLWSMTYSPTLKFVALEAGRTVGNTAGCAKGGRIVLSTRRCSCIGCNSLGGSETDAKQSPEGRGIHLYELEAESNGWRVEN